MWKPKIKSYKKDTPIRYPCGCEIKFDGEFVYWNGENALINKRKNPKSTISRLPNRAVYGELYGGSGKNFYSHKNKVILFDTDDYGKRPYIQRRTELELMRRLDIDITPMKICQNEQELKKYFNSIIEQGFEGVVAKPLDSLNDSSWVKIKKEYSAKLMVRGLRKGKTVPTISLGTKSHIYCSCSLNGWDSVVNLLTKEKERKGDSWVIGEDKDNYLLNSDIIVKIIHNGLIQPSNKLRHARVKALEDKGCELSIQKGQKL